MLSTIGFVILFAVGGIVLAAIWTFFIGFGGVPGAILSHKLAPNENWHDGSGNYSIPALVVCVAGQSYLALAFSAFAVAYSRDTLTKRPDLIGWVIWMVAFVIAILPTTFALKDAAKKVAKKTQDVAMTITSAIGVIGFWVFFFLPAAMTTFWGWVPFVG